MRGIERSATGEDALLEGPKASKSREYLDSAGDDGNGLGNALRGGDDCILLESISRSLVIVCAMLSVRWYPGPQWVVLNIFARFDARL